MDANTVIGAVAAIGSLLSGTAIVVALWQLRAMRSQLKDSQDWNRMSSAITQMPPIHELNELEIELNASIVKLIDRDAPMCAEEVEALANDPKHSRTRVLLKNYLTMLELYCLAVNCGLVDDGIAKRMYKYKFARHWAELKPYIDHVRTLRNEPTILVELETTATRWGAVVLPDRAYGE